MKTNTPSQFALSRSLLGAAAFALLTASASAAVIVPTYSDAGFVTGGTPTETAFAAVTTGDVLLGGAVVAGTGTQNTPGVSSLAGLTDGNIGTNAVNNNIYFNYPDGPYTFLIKLTTPTDLAKFQSIAGWTTDRISQDFILSYTTDASPTLSSSLTVIGTSIHNPGNGASVTGTESSTEVTFGDGTSSITNGQVATGLVLQFTSANGSSSVLREMQAYGISAVPEPSTYALMLGGLAFLGLVLRRKNSLR